MGYTTEFKGKFKLDRPLTDAHKAYLEAFSNTRRMARDAAVTEKREDALRLAVDLPVGVEGGYFVGAGGTCGQEGMMGEGGDRETLGILDVNRHPRDQPGLWCQWAPNENGTAIEWDGGEKFYHYVEWLSYIIEHFMKPWGYVLNGSVKWKGEERGDRGTIVVTDNVVETKGSVLIDPT
jgi:hypothetical protein